MKNRKAQAGITISWFVGFLVIIFILAFFFIIGFAKPLIQQTIQGKPSITSQDTEVFHESEQQRGLFSLFEHENENKNAYDITEDITARIERKKALNQKSSDYLYLNSTLNKIKENRKEECFNFSIIDIEYQKLNGGVGSWHYKPFYYFSSPKSAELDRIDRFDYIEDVSQKNSYSFFFPEKSFILIKYIPTLCPVQENE